MSIFSSSLELFLLPRKPAEPFNGWLRVLFSPPFVSPGASASGFSLSNLLLVSVVLRRSNLLGEVIFSKLLPPPLPMLLPFSSASQLFSL